MRKYSFIGFILISVILFPSCIAKKYTRPEAVTKSTNYRDKGTDTTNFATIDWRSFYADPFLIALIDTALKNNFDVKAAESQMRSALEYFKKSKAAFAPSVGLQLGVGVSGQNIDGKLKPVGTYSLEAITSFQTPSVGATWEIDVWGKLAAAKRSQKAKLEQSQAYYHAVKTQLVASIAQSYYALLAFDAQLFVYEASAKTRNESLEVLKALKQAAQTNEISVNQGAAQYYYTLVSIPQIKISIQTTENQIALLLGKTPQEITRGTLLSSDFAEVDFLQTGVPAQLLANRPDVIAAEKGLISAHEQWNYARAAMYPSFVISANAGFNASQFTNWFSLPQSFVGNLLGGLTAPLFAQRQLKTQRNVAAETKLQAIYEYEKTMLTAQAEVSDALVTYQYSKESIANQVKQLTELNNAVNGSMELLKNGKASYLDLLYAEDNALNSSVSLIQYYLQNTHSKVEMYRALGGGWK